MNVFFNHPLYYQIEDEEASDTELLKAAGAFEKVFNTLITLTFLCLSI